MERQSELKSARLLEIFSRLSQGAVLKKSELAQDFHVTPRSIQRDMGGFLRFPYNVFLLVLLLRLYMVLWWSW